ncbi:hypothetical protein [Limosilactobacillus mucosae]|uniref:Uncharacterized protein n=1 Tax=Limosilactobacillus mucosae TaxID=97478 RepID=A0AAJ1M9J4_LIMMU|nr:hypothetical protein [Limosilactobacillus mucosae]MDC2828956.1 hypothetical protein [Limosilactobacillus mucosae]
MNPIDLDRKRLKSQEDINKLVLYQLKKILTPKNKLIPEDFDYYNTKSVDTERRN